VPHRRSNPLAYLVTLLIGALVGMNMPTAEEAVPPVGHTARTACWTKARAAHLAKHPRCEVCGTANDIEVHHVVPFAERPDLECDAANLITLCRRDHFAFGHLYSWLRSNSHVVEDAARMRKRVEEAKRRIKP